MTEYTGGAEGTPTRVHVQSLPSDYTDVHSVSYDADFVSHISNKMQIPEKIGAHNDFPLGTAYDTDSVRTDMMVPDRILVAGEGKHIGAREGLRLYDFEKLPTEHEVPYVGLMTPPRTLTLEEQGFPNLSVQQTEEISNNSTFSDKTPVPNGSVGVPVQFTPGVSLNESLLLNDEDESKQLKTQVAKLTRRLAVVEQDNQRRSQRELVLYPVVFGYFFLKFLGWIFKTKHY